MLPVQWRRFNFFEKEMVKKGDHPNPIIQKIPVTCVASGRGQVFFGDTMGLIHAFEQDFAEDKSFQAFERSVTLMQQMKRNPVLVTLGEDDDAIDPTVKIFHTERFDNENNPVLWKTLKISNQTQIFPVTTMAVMEDLSCIALGLCNGTVIIFVAESGNNLVYEKNVRQRVIASKDVNPVTGLFFQKASRHLYIATNANVRSYSVDSEQMITLDEEGAELGNVTLSDDDGQLVVARKEAVYFYEAEGKGPCFALEADKKQISWFRNYLIIVGKETEGDINTFTVYDLKNKVVAFSGAFPNVYQIFFEWNFILILCRDGKLFMLDENDIQTKLETLFKKNLFSVAVALAISHGCEQNVITDIYKRYGDHLYGKGDYDGAIQQYVRTIGSMDASYVIMKFLDAARIHNLTTFLQALHEHKAANPDHTTLLLSCYTKLKDINQIDLFISADWTFSAETAIVVCRQAGYYPQALALAKKHREHEWVVRILVEDFKDADAALAYLFGQQPNETEKSLKEYGAQLAQSKPDEVVELLERLYRAVDEEDPDDFMRQPPSSLPEEFIHVFVRHSNYLIQFLEFILTQRSGSKLIYNTLLELYLQNADAPNTDPQTKKENLNKAYSILTDPASNYSSDQALILCELHRFQAGALFLYEKTKLYNEILQFYMNKFDYENVLLTCRRHGPYEPNLWVRSLFYFVVMDEPCEKEIKEVLQYIDRDNLLPPIQAVQILSQKKSVSIGLVREYIISRLEQIDRVTQENKKQISTFKEETEKMRAEIEEFRHSMKTIQAAKCSICHGQLDLPAVHFLCSHSFHLHCLPEASDECLVCSSSVKQLLETRRSLEAAADQHDKFMKQLEGSQDGFVTCAEYFGRHVFATCEPLALPSDKISAEQMNEELMIYERRNPKKKPEIVKVIPAKVELIKGKSSTTMTARGAELPLPAHQWQSHFQ